MMSHFDPQNEWGFSPSDPTYLVCACCDAEFPTREMKEDDDGQMLCRPCFEEVKEVESVLLDEAAEALSGPAHHENFLRIFREVSNA